MEEGRTWGEVGRAATVGPMGYSRSSLVHPLSDDGWALFPGEKFDSEEGKDFPKVSGLSRGAGVSPAQPLGSSYFQAIACPYPPTCPRLPHSMLCLQALCL